MKKAFSLCMKLTALVLALCLLCLPALAETADGIVSMNWEDYADNEMVESWLCGYISSNGLAMVFRYPESLDQHENLTNEAGDFAGNSIFNADQTRFLQTSVLGFPSIDECLAYMDENAGIEAKAEIRVNGYTAYAVSFSGDNTEAVFFPLDETHQAVIFLNPKDGDPEWDEIKRMIVASLYVDTLQNVLNAIGDPVGTWCCVWDNAANEFLSLNEDGTVWVIASNSEDLLEGTWTKDEDALHFSFGEDGAAADLTMTDGKLVLTGEDGSQAVYTRTTEDAAGDWYAEYMLDQDGILHDMSETGIVYHYTLNEDGTASNFVEGIENTFSEATWFVANGLVRYQDADTEAIIPGVRLDDYLILTNNKISLYLTRNPVSLLTAPPVDTQASAADFSGTWKPKYVREGDAVLELAFLGLPESDVIIEGQTLRMVNEEGEPESAEMAFEDGTMTFTDEDGSHKVELLEGGVWLSWTVSNDEQSATVYYYRDGTDPVPAFQPGT